MDPFTSRLPTGRVSDMLFKERMVPDSTQPKSDEEHVSVLEKDLADDAPWKKIQQRTFTRWVNERLRTKELFVNDLGKDFEDGLKLIALVEILSGKRLPRHNARPSFRSQKLENVSLALEFLEEEGIKLVSIDSADIVEGRLKLILGLIWALILHYSIAMPRWEGEGDQVKPKDDTVTPKQRLLSWFSNKLPGIQVRNFTTDWNDGRAAGALDNAVAPGLCPDWEDWDPKDALQNATVAMELAEKWLGIPQLIRPEDMVDPNIDEQSMMTYLAQFPTARLKPGALLRDKSSMKPVHPESVRCTGRGLQSRGIRLGDTVDINVSTLNAGQGALDVQIFGPDNQLISKEESKLDEHHVRFLYQPSEIGTYTVIVKFADQHAAKSPYKINVAPQIQSSIRAYGPGLATGAVSFPAEFEVDMNGESGRLGIEIEGPSEVMIDAAEREQSVISARYVPKAAGEYAIHILNGDEDIPGSPFMADIMSIPSDVDPYKVKVEVPETGIIPGKPAEIKVDTRLGGPGDLYLSVIDAMDFCEITTAHEERDGLHTFKFIPENDSTHIVIVVFGGVAVTGSPFKLHSPNKPSKTDLTSGQFEVDFSTVKITGFERVVPKNKLVTLTIDASEVKHRLDSEPLVSITSPSGIVTEAYISQKAPGVFAASFSVFEEGDHKVGISLNGNRIIEPVTISVQKNLPSRTTTQSDHSVRRHDFSLSQKESSEGSSGSVRLSHQESQIISSERLVTEKVPVVEYSSAERIAKTETKEKSANVRIGGIGQIGIAGLVRSSAPGKVNTFTVHTEGTEYNVLLVGIRGKTSDKHEVSVKHLGESRYQVEYSLGEVGDYMLTIRYGDRDIPGSPFDLSCL